MSDKKSNLIETVNCEIASSVFDRLEDFFHTHAIPPPLIKDSRGIITITKQEWRQRQDDMLYAFKHYKNRKNIQALSRKNKRRIKRGLYYFAMHFDELWI